MVFGSLKKDKEFEFVMINRSEVNTALSKAIAYKQCGKHSEAANWARKLIELLECAEILETQYNADYYDHDSSHKMFR